MNSGGGLKKDEYLEKQIHVVKTALCSSSAVLQQRVNVKVNVRKGLFKILYKELKQSAFGGKGCSVFHPHSCY